MTAAMAAASARYGVSVAERLATDGRGETDSGPLLLEIFEDGVPPRFKLSCVGRSLPADDVTIETVRPDGARQIFATAARKVT